MTATGVVSSSSESVVWPALDPWHDAVLERVSGGSECIFGKPASPSVELIPI